MFEYLKKYKKESEKCTNHPEKNALSFCHSCNRSFCKDCLVEGPQYYYCKSEVCMKKYAQEIDYSKNPRFCPKCISETTEEFAGDLISVNFIGDKFVNESREECPICGSIVLEKISSVFRRRGSYRVIWLNYEKTKFISRKVK